MYIEIKCRSCGKSFRVDFTKDEFSIEKCPKCEAYISLSDVSRIRNITERFYDNVDRLTEIEVRGIYANESRATGSAIMSDDLFDADIECLNTIYRSSPIEIKERLAALVDKFYLLVGHDAQKEDIVRLETTLNQLRDLFMERIKENQAQFEKVLGTETED